MIGKITLVISLKKVDLKISVPKITVVNYLHLWNTSPNEESDINLKAKGTQPTFTAFDEMLLQWKNKNKCLAKL